MQGMLEKAVKLAITLKEDIVVSVGRLALIDKLVKTEEDLNPSILAQLGRWNGDENIFYNALEECGVINALRRLLKRRAKVRTYVKRYRQRAKENRLQAGLQNDYTGDYKGDYKMITGMITSRLHGDYRGDYNSDYMGDYSSDYMGDYSLITSPPSFPPITPLLSPPIKKEGNKENNAEFSNENSDDLHFCRSLPNDQAVEKFSNSPLGEEKKEEEEEQTEELASKLAGFTTAEREVAKAWEEVVGTEFKQEWLPLLREALELCTVSQVKNAIFMKHQTALLKGKPSPLVRHGFKYLMTPLKRGAFGRRKRGVDKAMLSPENDEEFQKFWKIYPKQLGMDKAYEEWLKALRSYDPQEIIQAAKRYRAYVQKKGIEEKFIPLPANFLQRYLSDFAKEESAQDDEEREKVLAEVAFKTKRGTTDHAAKMLWKEVRHWLPPEVFVEFLRKHFSNGCIGGQVWSYDMHGFRTFCNEFPLKKGVVPSDEEVQAWREKFKGNHRQA